MTNRSSQILVAVLCLSSLICSSFANQSEPADSSDGWSMQQLARFFEDRGSHLYWLEIELDGDKVDSDYFWNGQSDLYFRIEIDGNPYPVFSSAYSKDYKAGLITAPFVADYLKPGSKIRLSIYDDDSGGKILEYIVGSKAQITNATGKSMTASVEVNPKIATPGGIIEIGSAGFQHTTSSSKSIAIMIEHPEWLIQNSKSELVSDVIGVQVPSPGESSPLVDITRKNKVVGTVRLISAKSTYTAFSKWGYAIFPVLLALGTGLFGWQRHKKNTSA